MKKILLALAVIGFGTFTAEAQSKKSIYDKNYPVCVVDGKYQVCPVSNKAESAGRSAEITGPDASFRMLDTSVYLGYSRPGSSAMRNPRIRVTIDDPQAPYEGKESMVNDGVQKNKQRNLNHNTNVELPPNDGGLSER
jgi:hypothetical protein